MRRGEGRVKERLGIKNEEGSKGMNYSSRGKGILRKRKRKKCGEIISNGWHHQNTDVI